jgi:hypothetical protein
VVVVQYVEEVSAEQEMYYVVEPMRLRQKMQHCWYYEQSFVQAGYQVLREFQEPSVHSQQVAAHPELLFLGMAVLVG